jgi:biopolymer transport protein ExbB/TolQ
LAAINLDIWVALATAIVTAFTTKLQADQVENSLAQYNQTLGSLRNIASWWKALSSWEKNRRKNIDVLVDQTEKALETETAGWVQQMQSALDKLTEKEQHPSKAG